MWYVCNGQLWFTFQENASFDVPFSTKLAHGTEPSHVEELIESVSRESIDSVAETSGQLVEQVPRESPNQVVAEEMKNVIERVSREHSYGSFSKKVAAFGYQFTKNKPLNTDNEVKEYGPKQNKIPRVSAQVC